MVAVNLPAAITIELHNESKIHRSFCDFERRNGREVIFERRLVLGIDERKSVPLNAGTVYITTGPGVVIHGL
jgi:hypothetical protein